ncbi:MAG: FliA/WhiG family RNA polymerase sigma factor [Candidatus Carbobacillus altaicus]|nr:FliA/WhiG family RNA polymerase sigma factor [Candidatus Carbobacillus altaicus]
MLVQRQHDLWQAYLKEPTRDIEALLLKSYEPLAKKIVSRMMVTLPAAVSREDLLSFAMEGLFQAIRRFDPGRGLKFETYATWRIRGAIYDGLREHDPFSRSLRNKQKRIEQAQAELEQKMMGPVSTPALSAYMGVSQEEVERTMEALSAWHGPNHSGGDTEVRPPFLEDQVDPAALHPEEETFRRALKSLLAQAIEGLTEKEKLVLSLFYYEGLTFAEVAQVLALSPSRISQLHTRALHKLRPFLRPWITDEA